MDKLVKWPATIWSLCIAAGLLFAVVVARAPINFKGTLPFVGDKFPFELSAIYFIVFGPIVAMGCIGALWMFIAFGPRPLLLGRENRDGVMLAVLFSLIAVLSIALSVQYFLILAPADLCATRPHFDFLLHGIAGPERITHCMSGTEAINAKAPYYAEPAFVQMLQSWGHVLWPLISIGFLFGAWRSWRRNPGGSR